MIYNIDNFNYNQNYQCYKHMN